MLSAFTAIGLWIVSLIDPTVQSCLRLVTIASTVVLLWRFIHVFTLFNVGVETTAVIQNILIYRIYDQVFFTYTFQDCRIETHCVLTKNANVDQFVRDQEITVLVDSDNPTRSLIKHLYI
jgi:hypothetical protein